MAWTRGAGFLGRVTVVSMVFEMSVDTLAISGWLDETYVYVHIGG